MTLIASVNSAAFICISDTLLSRSAFKQEAAVFLPLSEAGVTFTNKSGDSVIGLAQKTIVLTPTSFLQWAGSMLVARSVLKEVYARSTNGELFDFYDVIDNMGLSSAEWGSAAFNYGRFIEPTKLDRKGHLVQQIKHDNDVINFAGSGVFDFADSTNVEVSSSMSDPVLRACIKWFSRTLSVMQREVFSQDPLHFMYGGWFEFLIQGTDYNLMKMPYLLKFWTVEAGQVREGATIASWYLDHHLVIGRVMPPEYDVVVLPDPLARTNIGDLQRFRIPTEKPLVHFHIINRPDQQKTSTLIHYGEPKKYFMEVSADGSTARTYYGQSMVEELTSLFEDASPHVIISRPFD